MTTAASAKTAGTLPAHVLDYAIEIALPGIGSGLGADALPLPLGESGGNRDARIRSFAAIMHAGAVAPAFTVINATVADPGSARRRVTEVDVASSFIKFKDAASWNAMLPLERTLVLDEELDYLDAAVAEAVALYESPAGAPARIRFDVPMPIVETLRRLASPADPLSHPNIKGIVLPA